MQFTRPVWIHQAWKIGRVEQAPVEVEGWVEEGGQILEQADPGETWEVMEPTTRVTSRAGQTVVGPGSEVQGRQEVAEVASGQGQDWVVCLATCLETGLEAGMVGTTGAMAATTGAGVEVFGVETGHMTIMEAVLGGVALLQEAGEEEELPLQVHLPVLVQGLLQALGAPGGAKV